MGFLDRLEEGVKGAESREEAAAEGEREQEQRENERARARAAAPWAEKLRNSPFTAELLRQVTRIGHSRRVKVHMAWIGVPPYLRLEAREKRLELRPTPKGIVAGFFEDGNEVRTRPQRRGPGARMAGMIIRSAARSYTPRPRRGRRSARSVNRRATVACP